MYCPEWKKYLLFKTWVSNQKRVFKTHSKYQLKFSRAKIIYIVRDPRDVYISYFEYLKNKVQPCNIRDFMDGYNFPYGTWSDHVNSWIMEQDNIQILVVRYEDLLSDTETYFKSMLQFAGINTTNQCLLSSIKNSNFQEMQKIESLYGRKYQAHDQANKFVRSGKSGDWKNILSTSEADYILKFEDIKTIQTLGYPI